MTTLPPRGGSLSTLLAGLQPTRHKPMDGILDGLNVAQRAAVTSPAPVLQVLAPPGSGKTKTLTARVAYLLAHCGYLPWNVICCTFTIKASKEMRGRLRFLIGRQLESKLILGTFHSICRRYLVTYGYLIGIPKDFGIADSSDTLSILKRIVKRLNLSLDPKAARGRISHRKARGQRNEVSSKNTHKSFESQEFATLFSEYETALATSNLLDYDDLLLRCTDLLSAHPHCVSNVDALLIDEFQDTNVVQFELMKLLACKNNRVTIVGDPDQSIYGFRSAEIENLTRMKNYYPETIIVNLEENYRSASAVLRLAQGIIEQDTNRPQKTLKGTHCYGTLPVLRRLPTAIDEASWVVAEIRRITAMTGNLFDFSDFAFLLRSMHLSRLIEGALARAGIPYRMVGGHRFFDREEIRVLLDYLRIISQPYNNAALLAVINVPSRSVGEETTKELLRVADEKRLSLWAVVQKVVLGDLILQKKISKPAEQGLGKLMSIILEARKRLVGMTPNTSPKDLLDFVIKKISFENYIETKHPDDWENRWANVEELLTQASGIAEESPVSADTNLDEELPEIEGLQQQQLEGSEEVLARFLATISLSADLQSSEEGEEKKCVTISTIHAAKGLEWPVVFIPAIYEGSIPHSRAEDNDEERRLLYVAITRAQALLYMSIPLRQSRDNAESTLTQFLPYKLHHRFWEAGPNFTDNVIADISKILRRPRPPEEQIAASMQGLSGEESTKDDIWPPDGSSRPVKYWNSESTRFVSSDSITAARSAESRRLLKATLKPLIDMRPTADSSTAWTGYASTKALVGHNAETYSITTTCSGFTTASLHLKSNALLAEIVPELSLSKDLNVEASQKNASKRRDKKVKQGPSQACLASYLSHGSFQTKTSQAFDDLGSSAMASGDTVEGPCLPVIPLSVTNKEVSRDWLSHRVSNRALPLKRPRPPLEEVTSPKHKRYVFLSSSPTRDEGPTNGGPSPDTENQAPARDPMTVPMKYSNVSAKSSLTITTNPTSLQRPVTTMHTTSMAALQQSAPVRKTLGVRRTMNGWDNRRNR